MVQTIYDNFKRNELWNHVKTEYPNNNMAYKTTTK
jgi:predicted nucleic acid binding AN1-type Zn finger protein